MGDVAWTLREAIERQDELADWFESEGPSPENRRPVWEFFLGIAARAASPCEQAEAVGAALRAGASWQQVGEAFDLSADDAAEHFASHLDEEFRPTGTPALGLA